MLLERNIVPIVRITVPKSDKHPNIGGKNALPAKHLLISNDKKRLKILLFPGLNVEDNRLHLPKERSKRSKDKINRGLNNLDHHLNDLPHPNVRMDSLYRVYEKSQGME